MGEPLFWSVLVDGISPVLFGVILSALATCLIFVSKKEARQDPGLPPLLKSCSGWDFTFGYLSKSGHQFLLDMARTMDVPAFQAPEVRLLPFLPPLFRLYVIKDCRLARSILESTKCSKPYPSYQIFDLVAGGETFFSANGTRAFHVRKAVSPCFAQQHINRMANVIEEILETWIEGNLKEETVIDMGAEMLRVTVDIIGKVAFDYEFSPLERERLIEDLNVAFDEWFRGVNPLRKMGATGWLFAGVRKARHATERILQMFCKILQHYREKDPNTRDDNIIVSAIANNPNYSSDQQRARDMLAFFFAGFDTTASALGFVFLELARHPQEQVKLRQELVACSGRNERMNCGTLKNTIREILRLYPPAALGSGRELQTDLPIPGHDPLYVPSGSLCMIPFYVIQRDGGIFEQPDEFRPSRWEDSSKDSLFASALMPFSLGRRNCVGMALAQVELHVVVAQLLSEFEFSLVQEGETNFKVTLKVVGAKLAVKRASTQ